MSIGYIVLMVVIFAASMGASWKLKSKFKKYSQEPLRNGMSGKEIAERMLHDNGIGNVQVVSVPGKLTDHYNPMNKTVNLSPDVYSGRNVAAAAVAAHECGHAVQHAQAYAWLTLRSKLVPVQAASGKILNAVMLMMIFGGFFLFSAFPIDLVLLVLIACYGVLTTFSFVTLPVEFDASNRALAWLENTGITSGQEQSSAKDALKWAAMTYVVAALGSLATLLYYLSIFLGRRD
ncbi:MAG: zinc metallopeptidase [Chitinophagales bacterium]